MNLLTPLAVRLGSSSWMPRLLPQITAVDKSLQQVTAGRLTLLDLAGLPNLMLTVKGRKSGVHRTTPLMCVPHGSDQLIAGSNFGQDKLPVWVLNVRAAAEHGEQISMRVDGLTHQAIPREVTGAERDTLWEKMNEIWPNYAMYARRTDRTIPIFALERTG